MSDPYFGPILQEPGRPLQPPTVRGPRPPRYLHGGAPGLAPGDLLTPRAPGDHSHLHPEGRCATCDARRAGRQLAYDNNNPALIYITTDRDYARLYAAGYPRGAVYVVEPQGEMTDRWRNGTGEDCVPSWGVPSARIVRVLDPLVNIEPKEQRRLERRWKLTPGDVRRMKLGIQ